MNSHGEVYGSGLVQREQWSEMNGKDNFKENVIGVCITHT